MWGARQLEDKKSTKKKKNESKCYRGGWNRMKMHIFIFMEKKGENAHILESRVGGMLGSEMAHCRGNRNNVVPHRAGWLCHHLWEKAQFRGRKQ